MAGVADPGPIPSGETMWGGRADGSNSEFGVNLECSTKLGFRVVDWPLWEAIRQFSARELIGQFRPLLN